MEHFFGDRWKHLGIYDAIKMTEHEIHMDRPLLAAALCFWSSATNTMNLPLGSMTLTLLDMVAIFGFRPYGGEVSAVAKLPTAFRLSLKTKENDQNVAKKQKRNVLNYGNIYSEYAVNEEVSATNREEPKKYEHAAFLLYWLCKFVFCPKSAKCCMEFAGVAESLASGTSLALGTFVLAYVYRTLRSVVTNNMSLDVGGPLWIFQVWVQTYFHELRPVCHSFDSKMTLIFMIITLGALAHSAADCFAFLFEKTSMTDDEFSICCERDYPQQYIAEIGKSWEKPLDIMVRLFWGSILICRDLNYGFKPCGVEVYHPNFASRQLGFIQGCPALFTSSINFLSSWREKITADKCEEIRAHYSSKCQELEILSVGGRIAQYRCTRVFRDWWSRFTKKIFEVGLAEAQRIALQGLPDLSISPRVKKNNGAGSKASEELPNNGKSSKRRAPISDSKQAGKRNKKTVDEVVTLAKDQTDLPVVVSNLEHPTIGMTACSNQNILVSKRDTVEEEEDMDDTCDGADSTDDEDCSAESGTYGYKKDGRLGPISPAKYTFVEFDLDDDLDIFDFDMGARPTDINGRVSDLNGHSQVILPKENTHVQVGNFQDDFGLELAVSPFVAEIYQNEHALVCVQSSAGPKDQVLEDFHSGLSRFLDSLGMANSPVEEKCETDETKKALGMVRQFLGYDMREITQDGFLSFKEAIELLISSKHFSQSDAYKVGKYLAIADYSIPACLKAHKELEAGEKLKRDFDDIYRSANVGQYRELSTSLDEKRQKVISLKKQLAEAEDQVKTTQIVIQNLIPEQDLAKYRTMASLAKSYDRHKDLLKLQVDQGIQDLARIKEDVLPLLPVDM